MTLLCVSTLVLEFRDIERTLPYPRHVDEGFISGPARNILQTGTLHPQTFNYPSLPKYLAAAGMAIGFLRGASHLEIREIRSLGSTDFPYYDTPRVMQTARQLFALLSIVTLAATGFSAWLAFERPAAIFLAPLILLMSPLFFFHSWTYLNVDIVGTTFASLTLAAVLWGIRYPSTVRSAVVPAAFAGLAAGSKYTLVLVSIAVLTGIGLYFTGTRRTWALVTAVAVTVGAFLVAVPYSILDIPRFLDGVGSEAFHYASGHRGYNGEPGLSQLLYYGRHFAREFGLAAPLAVVGIMVYATSDWRRTSVLTVFPVALLWLLASQRVHFARNVLSLHPFVAMFGAFGFIALYGFVTGLATRRGWVQRPVRRRTQLVIGMVLLVATLPLWHLGDCIRNKTDSRNVARVWIDQRLPAEWTIVIPTELAFDKRLLEATGRKVVVIDGQPPRDAGALQSLVTDVPSPAAILVPRWGADSRYPGQEVADTLNQLWRRWRVVQRFGTNDVLVNYSRSTPSGDPAFAVAVLR